jgi:hypothetical protein
MKLVFEALLCVFPTIVVFTIEIKIKNVYNMYRVKPAAVSGPSLLCM